MTRACTLLSTSISSLLKSRASLQLENLALRHQIGVLQRSAKKRPKLVAVDRVFWAWLCHVWSDWRWALVIVKPDTVIGWHRKGFRTVLDLEGQARTTRATAGRQGHSRPDPEHESRESAVGRAEDPR